MNLIIPPPIVAAVSAFLMWVLSFAFPEANVLPALFKSVAYLLVLIGIAIEIACVVRFFKLKTTINPLKPERSQILVTQGLFQFSRNPMYLGMSTLLVGFALWLGNPLSLLPLAGFIWYITEFQIKPEENVLRDKFGLEYKNYLSQVRRWI